MIDWAPVEASGTESPQPEFAESFSVQSALAHGRAYSSSGCREFIVRWRLKHSGIARISITHHRCDRPFQARTYGSGPGASGECVSLITLSFDSKLHQFHWFNEVCDARYIDLNASHVGRPVQ